MNDHAHDDHHRAEPLAPVEARVAAIESVLVEQGLFDTVLLDAIVANFEDNLGPLNGAKVVARAWVDPDYKVRLLVVENTPHVHNLVVCTLCSCYPWPTLGLPPTWYKAPAYRSRAVREPRVLLAEMGTTLPDDVEIRVWDSSAEVRYLVLPERPARGGSASEEELAALVTRDSMIGVERL